MGIQVNSMSTKSSRYIDAIYGVCDEIIYRLPKIWLIFDFIYFKTKAGKRFLEHVFVLHDTTSRVINERKKVLTQKQDRKEDDVSKSDFGEKKRKAFLDLLLELSNDGIVLTDKQIREEVDTFLFEVISSLYKQIKFLSISSSS